MPKRIAISLSVLTALVAFTMLTWSLSFAQGGPGIAGAGLDGVTNIPSRQPETPEDWYGVWQYGDPLTAAAWGGPANEGLARFSGHFYTATNKIYFLGGRRESNDTTGVIFTFDPNTGIYASTGVTIPNAVSNYLISQIDNDGQGNGPGLYIVAGRLNSGTNSNFVQVYYPNANTAQTIASDPIPGSPRAVGGQAVVNGKLYAFGGFDAAVMYDETYVYDPQATAGTRWSNTNCDLPTARSYIATAVVGTKIYAIGGDLFDGAALIPITDTVVLDTANLGACWQDGDMADLPDGFANGDAPAVYITEGYLDGGIYVVGGSWPAPGPFNWVFRYDVAGDSWDVEFPVLNQARRNYALVYVPASACSCESLGDGIPGMWAFGGYDGTAANAMTESSEYFSIEGTDVFLFPDAVEKASVAGTSVQFNMIVLNDTGDSHTYDVTYSQVLNWDVTAPATAGPVAAGSEAFFPVTIDLPAEADCPTTNTITITVTAQGNSSITDSQDIGARVACGVGGKVLDANTSTPISDAFIWMEDVADPNNTNYETYTNNSGDYSLIDIPPATYRLYASAVGHQGSFYPSGWPTGAVTITLSTDTVLHNFELAASDIAWSAAGLANVTAAPGATVTHTFGSLTTALARSPSPSTCSTALPRTKIEPPSPVSAA